MPADQCKARNTKACRNKPELHTKLNNKNKGRGTLLLMPINREPVFQFGNPFYTLHYRRGIGSDWGVKNPNRLRNTKKGKHLTNYNCL
jgi:hypothetical protein